MWSVAVEKKHVKLQSAPNIKNSQCAASEPIAVRCIFSVLFFSAWDPVHVDRTCLSIFPFMYHVLTDPEKTSVQRTIPNIAYEEHMFDLHHSGGVAERIVVHL